MNLSALLPKKEEPKTPQFDLMSNLPISTQTTTPAFIPPKEESPKAIVPIKPLSEKIKQLNVEALKAEKEAEKGLLRRFVPALGEVAKDISQSITRNIASAGVTISKVIKPEAEFKLDDLSLFGQELSSRFFGLKEGEEIKSIEQRIAEAEPKIKEWGEQRGGTLGEIAKGNPEALAFVGIMGSVGLDLTFFGGMEKNALKAMVKTKSAGEAIKLLLKMGVADDLARRYAPDVVSVKTEKEAKALFESIGNMQLKTKVAPTIAPEARKGVAPALKAEKVPEARKFESADWRLTQKQFVEKYPDVMNKRPQDMQWIEAEKIYVQGKLAQSKEMEAARKAFREVEAKGFNIGDKEWNKAARKIERIDKAADREISELLQGAKKGDKSALVRLEQYKSQLAVKGIGIEELEPSLLPTVIQGDTFTLGAAKEITPTIKEARIGLKAEIKATKLEIKNAEIAAEKTAKLELKQQEIRQETIENINRIARGNVENIQAELKARYLSDEDIANIVLEDGTKLSDVIKVKRNPDRSLSTLITKREIDDIAKSYTDEVPKAKWEKRSKLVEGVEIPFKIARGIELPSIYFERKGLTQIYDPIIQAGRDARNMKTYFLQKFKDAKLFKEGGWFTADRFTLSKNEAEGVAKYYLGRQGKGKEIPLTQLSGRGRKFVEIFDGIIKETEQRFFETAKKMGKTPGKVENYAPLMTSKDIKLIDEGGSMDWLFRNHPAFFSLKERMKKVPVELYELDYREVTARWLDGITDFLNYGETTNHLKYLVNSDQFKNIVKEQDWSFTSKWLQEITTPYKPSGVGEQALSSMSRFLRKGIAIGTLGLNYASVAKQALTQIPIIICDKTLPKFKSQYAKAFGINVADLPSIRQRIGDIAIKDLQGKIGRIFTGSLTQFDKKNAQFSLNGLLDKIAYQYVGKDKMFGRMEDISPQIRALIEKRAQDVIDKWYGGFFKGQRPEFFKKETGNFVLMFLYPLTSQLNGFYRHILTAQGASKVKATAEVLAAATAIAYVEQVIENLSPQWSDEVGMTKDTLQSLAGNIPLVGNLVYAFLNEKEINISPVIGNFNNIIRAWNKDDKEKALFILAESFYTPKTIRRIKEGMEIMEEGGITDNEGKMLAPVQDTMELVRSFLRGKYGSIAAQDWVRNIGEKRDDRRWFVPQVEFLQNGDYDRKAELYRKFLPKEQKELRDFLSEEQQKRLDKALSGTKRRKTLEEIFK